MESLIHEYLKFLAQMKPGDVWTEHHWKEANVQLLTFEIDGGIQEWKDIDGDDV